MKSRGIVNIFEGFEATPLELVYHVLDAIPDAIGIQDRRHRVLWYNKAARDMLGLDDGPLDGRRCYEYIGAPRTCERCATSMAIQSKEATSVTRHVSELGIWLEVRAYPLFDAEGRVNRIVEHLRDITDTVRAEEQLREKERQFRLLTENQRDVVLAVDTQGFLTYCSPAIREFAGYDPQAVIGTHLSQYIVSKEDVEKVIAIMMEMHQQRASVTFEVLYKPANRESFPVEITAKAVVEDDVVVGFQGIMRDITARLRAAEEKCSLEQQLLQAQKMEAVGRLAGGVAHDFNNLLTGISGYAELMMGQLEPNAPLYADAQEVLEAAKRGASLTNQLLAFSRKQVISPKIIDLDETIERARKLLRRLIGEDIELVFKRSSSLCSIKADPAQIDQILVNLATNARDAMPTGGRLSLETKTTHLDAASVTEQQEMEAGRYVRLSVTDTGLGMDEHTLSLVFEPFFTTKDVGRGTGLGLSTVYGIVKQNNGFVTINSELNQGTTVDIYFPLAAAQPQDVPPARVGQTIPAGTETVLLVEDEKIVRDLAERLLTSRGYRVITAGDGESALATSNQFEEEIDLLLTDVVLPTMNGVELHQALLTYRPSLPVLFMSGHIDDRIEPHGVLDHEATFISKPFRADELLRKVRAVLDA